MNAHDGNPARKRWAWLLAAVTLAALLLRLWGTWYGLPFTYYNDEYHEVMRALQLGTGSFNFDRTTKGGFYLVLFVEYGLYYVWLKLTGAIQSAPDFAILFVRDPSMFYLLGRMTAAVVGALTVVAVFGIGQRAYSTTAGLLAALFLAFNVLHIDHSRRIGVDVPMTLMTTLALYYGVRVATAGQRRDYVLAALCAALAVTTKLPGILVLLPLMVAHTYCTAAAAGGVRGWFASRNLWLAVAVFLLVMFVTNPAIFIETGFIRLFLPRPESVGDVPADVDDALTAIASRPNLYLYYLEAIQQSMGWPLFVLGLLSLLHALWKRTPADAMLVSFVAVNYIVISSTSSDSLYYPRYTLPIIVALAALSGRTLAGLLDLWPRAATRAVALASAGLVAFPMAQSLDRAHLLVQPDTRSAAKKWFEANVPPGSRVLIEGGWIYPLRETVQLSHTREALQRSIGEWKEVDARRARLLEYQVAGFQGVGYDLVLMSVSSVGSLDQYASEGVEYFVVRPGNFLRSRGATNAAVALLEALRSDPRVELLKRFESDRSTPISPTVEIYRLVSDPADPAARSGIQ